MKWTWSLRACGAVALLSLLALGLRIHRLDAEELWVDEADSYRVVTSPDFGHSLRFNSVPPFYWLVLRGWIAVFGDSDLSLRLPSALAGVLFVLCIGAVARELFGREAGLWASGFAALAPIHVYYSQEARPYSSLLLLLAGVLLALTRAAQRDRRRDWLLVAGLSALALYCHYLALLALLPGAAVLLAFPGRRQVRGWLASGLLAGLLFVPWIPVALGSGLAAQDALGWIERVWQQTPPSLALPRSLEVLGLGSEAGLLPTNMKQMSRVVFPPALRLMGLLALAAAALAAALPWGDRTIPVPRLGGRKAFVAALLFFPLLALGLASFVRPIYVAGRYDLLGFPGYCLGLGLGLAKLRRLPRVGPPLLLLVLIGLLLPMAVKLGRYYQVSPQRMSSVTAQFLAQHVRHGDVVVLGGLRGIEVLAYLRRSGLECSGGRCRDLRASREFGCRMYPRSLETTPGKEPVPAPADQDGSLRDDVGGYLAALASVDSAVWVVLSSVSLSPGGIQVPREDARLFAALQAFGFDHKPVPARPWIFRWTRVPGPGGARPRP